MTCELSSLISRLKTYQPIGTNKRPHALGFITDYVRFVNTLENIETMIGLTDTKKQIAHQVKSFIVNYRRFETPTHGQKLHTLLYGPPGCGKTQLGQYLAELWACSGCLPRSDRVENNDVKLFHHQPQSQSQNSQSVGPQLLRDVTSITPSVDTEKITLRQNLAIKEAQNRQFQQQILSIHTKLSDILTIFNNVRKKVRAKIPDHEHKIQAKFQQIKTNLRDMSGRSFTTDNSLSNTNTHLSNLSWSGSLKNSPINNNKAPEILPVTLPKIAGLRSVFGSSHPPLLPQLPRIDDPVGINTKDILSQLPPVNSNKPIAKFVRITRGDLIGKYQGHTTDQVRKVLLEHVGGVVMIDEAYTLCTSSQDDFGKEALTEIINFMTTWPDKIIFIFAGYRREMEEGILKLQPGLSRRFNWTFEITGYDDKELSLIFQQQIKTRSNNSISLSDETIQQLDRFFKTNVKKFPHFGGDTETFCDIVRETFNQQNWLAALDDSITQESYNQLFREIDFDTIQTSFDKYLASSAKQKEEERKKKNDQESLSRIQHIYT